jgi:hypothetical protein
MARVAVVFVVLCIICAHSVIIPVNPTSGDDGICSRTSSEPPCATIQQAMNIAESNDVISLVVGVDHAPPAPNGLIPPSGKNLTLRSASPTALATLDCSGNGRAMYMNGGSGGARMTLERLNVTSCRATWGGALYINEWRVVIVDSWFEGNSGTSTTTGGGE